MASVPKTSLSLQWIEQGWAGFTKRGYWRVSPLLSGLLCSMLLAQVAPATKAIEQEWLRQQEREHLLRQQQEQVPDVRLKHPQLPDILKRLPRAESPCFKIDRILLQGEQAQQFQWAVRAAHRAGSSPDSAVGRYLDSAGINLVMQRIQNAIVQRGFITTRVLAGPQNLNSGTLILTLIPGRIGAIRFTEASDVRATQWNALFIRPAALLNLRDIEQGLENFKRLPSVEVDMQIIPAVGPAAKVGESDLLIDWKRSRPLRLNLSADDAGSKITGRRQGTVTLSCDHGLNLNDLFYITLQRDLGGGYPGKRGTWGHIAHYSLPLGYNALSVTHTRNDYHHQIIAGASQEYLYSGISTQTTLELSRLIHRTARRKITLAVKGWKRKTSNAVGALEVYVQRYIAQGWEASIAQRAFLGSAILETQGAYKRGRATTGVEAFGQYTEPLALIHADIQLNLPFKRADQRFNYSMAWRAQCNRTPLTAPNHFSIGGRYTVRGFDGESTLLAERGWLVRNTLGMGLGQSGQEAYIGMDYGVVSGPSIELLAGTRLAGAVIGLRGAIKGLNYDLFIGQPISKPKHFNSARCTLGFNISGSL